MYYYINKTNYKFLDIPYYYKFNDIFTDKPFVLPSKDKLLKFIENFKFNYSKSHLFKITIFGGYNSNSKNTQDVDMTLSYNDISHKNYEDIYDCIYFLISTAIKIFDIKLDLFYVDKHYSRFNPTIMNYCIRQNIDKLKEHDFNIYNNQGESLIIKSSLTMKSEKKSFHYVINEKKNIIINIGNNKRLIKIKHYDKSIKRFIKQIKHIKNGRIYYNDVVLFQNNTISYNYFKI